jgi:ribosome-binding ATPase YchF (GTP1/OBG family)
LTDEEKHLLHPYAFLTQKRVLYVPNVSEDDLPQMENSYVAQVREYARSKGAEVIPICAKIEEEIARLEVNEQGDFLESLGLQESGLNRLSRASFSMLGLITFLTTGEMETRAWIVERGATAPEAASKIHTDIQKGFIRAEVVSYDDMVSCGGWAEARAQGKLRSEGRSYIVQDGDVINFLHN